MGMSFPRISVSVDHNREDSSNGVLSELSVGFGIHQAWIFGYMLGSPAIFGSPSLLLFGDLLGVSVSTIYLISTIVVVAVLLFMASTDQKFIRHYTSRRMLVSASALTVVGTLVLFASSTQGSIGALALVFSGVTAGIGSAVLLIFWGVAYSRNGAATIVLNSAVSVVFAVAVYAILLCLVPVPFSGLLVAVLPVLELPLLWKLTPISYVLRHATAIFNPLPVKKGVFALRFAVPSLLFGFAIGACRTFSVQEVLPFADPTTLLLVLFVGGAVTVIILFSSFFLDSRSHWDFMFRPVLSIVAITLLCVPMLAEGVSVISALMILVGYMCLESLVWIFFCEISQEFRISPILVFGIGRGCVVLGCFLGVLMVLDPVSYFPSSYYGNSGEVVFILIALLVAYALLPRVRDIKSIVRPSSSAEDMAEFEKMNVTTQKISWKTSKEKGEKELGSLSGNVGTPSGIAKEGEASADSSGSGQPSLAQEYPKDSLSEDEFIKKSGRFRMQCETISNRYLLSRREQEVLFLLAKGYNAALIQDKLCISKSTAKTHIAHIYRKLDIHNQHELLAMVDEERG